MKIQGKVFDQRYCDMSGENTVFCPSAGNKKRKLWNFR
jgi:hypothetical protein